jgi:hypothetical protein
MAHNDQVSGSHTRTTNVNTDEARILVENNILIQPAWHRRMASTCPLVGTL